jgi:hypothetical protein
MTAINPDAVTKRKSFAQVLCNVEEGAVFSQLPKPSFKGNSVSVKITQHEYFKGVDDCKNHLLGRLLMGKGDNPMTARDLSLKMGSIW